MAFLRVYFPYLLFWQKGKFAHAKTAHRVCITDPTKLQAIRDWPEPRSKASDSNLNPEQWNLRHVDSTRGKLEAEQNPRIGI